MNQHLPSSALTIRPASFNDIQHIREIAAKTWPSAYEAILGKEQLTYMVEMFYSADSLAEQIKNNHYFFLALKDYQPIGFASFSQLDTDVYKLQKLYVLPGTQKTGAGKELLTKVETVAKSMGAATLLLNVNRKNIARSFYRKHGFEIVKEEDIDIGQGYFMNDFVMGKKL